MTTSAILMNSGLRKADVRKMKMMIYGMEKDVAQAAVAVNGTTHFTSASTSTTPHLRTWKSDLLTYLQVPIHQLLLSHCLS